MAINYREVGLASQLLGGGFNFDFKESGQMRDIALWTDVDFLRARLRCTVAIDRGESKLLKPLIDGAFSRSV